MYCLIQDHDRKALLEFKHPASVIRTRELGEVKSCLREAVKNAGHNHYAVGFVTYEAAPAFDEAFVAHPSSELPLVCFGIYPTFSLLPQTAGEPKSFVSSWQPAISKSDYEDGIHRIKQLIAAGDTYQVNYTFKLLSHYYGDARQLFLAVQHELQAEFAAFIDLENQAICSFSPELFFTCREGLLRSKPMKGTAARGLTLADDRKSSIDLAQSTKNRAENIMIVDMVRNDMGRIAKPGSVQVTSMYEVEKQPYVWQMTSTVVSQVDAKPDRVFEVLFPCASITGAPKISTMKIINQLEPEARGIYTGAIGYIDPQGAARFNVAIRTLVIDKRTGQTEYGVGSGIVWDSETQSEYEECLMKADFLKQPEPDIKLYESLLWEKANGFFLLEEHLTRLASAAEYFSFPYTRAVALNQLEQATKNAVEEALKIKLLLDRKGNLEATGVSLAGVKSSDLKVGLAGEPVHSHNRFLYHKTTERSIYEKAMKSRPDCDDVILWNEKGEITESCRANLVAEIDGRLVTPPVQCGLLAGTFRNFLLRSGDLHERIITIEEIKQAKRLFTINSVRRWMNAELV